MRLLCSGGDEDDLGMKLLPPAANAAVDDDEVVVPLIRSKSGSMVL